MNTIKNSFEKEIFTDSQYHTEYQTDEGLTPYTGEEYNLHKERMNAYYICQLLIAHSFRPPFIKGTKYRRNYAGTTTLGRKIIDFIIKKNLIINLDSVQNRFNPQLRILKQIADAATSKDGADVPDVGFIPPLPVNPGCYPFTKHDEIDVAVKAYSELAMRMRTALLNLGMRGAVKNFLRNSMERQKHLLTVARQAWERHSSILLIRLDWGYGKTRFLQPYHCMDQNEFETCLREVAVYRDKKLHELNRMFGKDLVFYAWKIECGDKKGIHMHWLIGLNGSRHQDRINVGLRIQRAWDAAISNAHTYTFNVNAIRNAERSGLRVIHYNDPELWEILGRYVDYLLKVDYTLKLRMPKGMRSFGCTKLRSSSGSKPGPKRRHHMQYHHQA